WRGQRLDDRGIEFVDDRLWRCSRNKNALPCHRLVTWHARFDHGWNIWQRLDARIRRDRQRPQLTLLHLRQRRRDVVVDQIDVLAKDGVERRRRAREGNRRDVDLRQRLEQLDG